MSLNLNVIRGLVQQVLESDNAIDRDVGVLIDHIPQGSKAPFARGWEHYLPGSRLSSGSWGKQSFSGLRGEEASQHHGVYTSNQLVEKIIENEQLTSVTALRKWLKTPLLGTLREVIGVSKVNTKYKLDLATQTIVDAVQDASHSISRHVSASTKLGRKLLHRTDQFLPPAVRDPEPETKPESTAASGATRNSMVSPVDCIERVLIVLVCLTGMICDAYTGYLCRGNVWALIDRQP
eukprot:m.253515 g.253515  ORF g.253515 m.253515 type:complete len:236 (-) comp19585_c0_seq3:106-813(-)